MSAARMLMLRTPYLTSVCMKRRNSNSGICVVIYANGEAYDLCQERHGLLNYDEREAASGLYQFVTENVCRLSPESLT